MTFLDNSLTYGEPGAMLCCCRAPWFAAMSWVCRRLVISCDIPRRGDLDGFFRIRVLTRVILVVLQACFHMSKSNSAPQTAGLFATLVFGFVVLGFLARTLRKGRQCFDAWAAFENKGIGFERGTHEETQLLQYTTVPLARSNRANFQTPYQGQKFGHMPNATAVELLLSIPLLCVRLDLAAVPAPTVGLFCHFFASRHEELARGALPTHCGETGRSVAVFLMFFSSMFSSCFLSFS